MSQSGVGQRVQPLVMELSRTDIGPMLKRWPQCNSLSPFAEEKANGGQPSKNLVEFSQVPVFEKVMEILTQPELQIHHRLADPTGGLTLFSAYFSREQANLIAVLYPAPGDALYLRVFTSIDEYLYWWLGTLGTKTDKNVENVLAEPMSMETFIYVLHAIDSYRRLHYQTALNFESVPRGVVNANEFGNSLLKSMESHNYLWLLPSFLRAASELQNCNIAPAPNDLLRLKELEMLSAGVMGGENVMAFGPRLERLGTEFKIGFQSSMGLSATVQTHEGTWVSERLFLAPTLLTNHLFEVLPGTQSWIVRHRPCTLNDLIERFTKIIYDGIRASSESIPDSARIRQVKKEKPQQAASAVAAAPKPVKSEAAAKKAEWRKLTPEYLQNAARAITRAQKASGTTNKAVGDLFKVRDRKGVHWRFALTTFEWYTVRNNSWVLAQPPEEFWMEEKTFQALEQEQKGGVTPVGAGSAKPPEPVAVGNATVSRSTKIACPSCHEQINASSRFCSYCAAKVS
jgi:hypothetical protein